VSTAAAAIAWRRAQHAAVCGRLEPWEHGTAVFADDIPGFWTYNSVRVEGPDAGLGADGLVAAADRLQAGLAHRHVEVEDATAGARARPGLEALGWIAERNVWMSLDGPPRPVPPAVEVTELPFAHTRPLREAWFTQWMGDAEHTRRFMALEERVGARRGTRALAAWGPAGELAGFVSFSAAGDSAEVEQAYVVPERRGSGIGGALVAAAAATAGARTTFIVADDEGDPKRLYARLGFAPVWIQHVFTRRP
jgi:GNAT superfamily N-acetyltransferase